MPRTARDRLVNAAFELFAEQGYEGTTVEEIAARAGTGRTTFFRAFRTKEDVVFPDHDAILEQVDARLNVATETTQSITLREAARIVLEHYLAEGRTAHERYQLISAAPTLRDRESASVQRYLRLFSRHVRTWLAGERDGALRADLLAASVIVGHNHVLRDWLRGVRNDPRDAFEHAMDVALSPTLAGRPDGAHGPVVVIHNGGDVDAICAQVRTALSGQ